MGNFLKKIELSLNINRKIIFSGLALPILILAAYFFAINTTTKPDQKLLTCSFQKTLQIQETLLETKLSLFVSTFSKEEPSFKNFNDKTTGLQDNYTDFFIYKKDSLFRWTTNEVTVPPNLNDKIKSHTILWLSKGFYILKREKKGDYTYLAVQLLKSDYPFHNDYIVSKYHPAYDIPQDSELTDIKNSNKITSKDRYAILYIDFPETINNNTYLNLSLLSFIFLLVTLSIFIYNLIKIKRRRFKLLEFSIYALLILAIRILISFIPISQSISTSVYLSPFIYASSDLLPSLAHLIINTIFILQIVLVFNKTELPDLNSKKKNDIIAISLFFAISFSLILGACNLAILIDSFVTNSNIPLNLSNIYSINYISLIILVILFAIGLSYYLLSKKLYYFYTTNYAIKRNVLVCIFLLSFITVLLFKFEYRFWFPYVIILLFHIILLKNTFAQYSNSSFVTQLTLLILFSVFASSILYSSSKNKEKELRKSYANKLTAKRDKLAEFLYPAIEKQILKDSLVIKYLKQSLKKPEAEHKLLDYVKTKFANNYWNKYEVQAYICRPGSKLQIQPANVLVGCENYFSSIITNMGFKTISNNLYYIDESYDIYTYISKIDIPESEGLNQKMSIYLEFYSKMTTSSLGYPELLIDNEFYQRIDLSEYSYALFHQGDLAKSVGDYQYQLKAPTTNSTLQNSFYFFDKNNYNHLYVKTSPYTSILISRKKPSLINTLSYFSYIFIISALLILLFKLLTSKNPKLLLSSTIKQRLQFWTITIILLSSITIGCVMLFYLFDLDKRKNQNILSDKAHSVLVELEQRFSYLDDIHKITPQVLSQNLSNYSNIFFTDINLFDKNGDLIATSRPQLYEAELISKKMNPLAYYSLNENQQIIEIKDEKIGAYVFQSAYVPLRDTKNKTLGYINLPYFARESEFRADLSTLLVAFINIYVILTVIAVLIALIVSSYITRPLQIIKDKISQINYFKKPEKISWQGADELADLIKQYNNMVDDLANSAELLARSERESAWRIMAQQVAHEIKNPLTPMKLNVQHLQRAWQDNKEDWSLRLDRFTQTMVTQIDALSTIAGEFSDFAKMPNNNLEIIDLNQCVKESGLLFTDSSNLTINIKSKHAENWIKADKQQVTRILNNLFRNSIQAINTDIQGIITISIYEDNKFKILEFTDNGIGIKKEDNTKIFTPFFTTKTAGTGLGLAMVKNITESFGGTIDFVSSEGNGTTFILSFPSSDEPKK